nr:manganese catalase family protein [Romboutsia weinsteinii]
MWIYQKTLEYPVNIKCGDLKMAKFLITQFGGPNGELGAALRYLSQRYTMPTGKSRALLTDIGTEELAHVEIISTMVYQLTENATPAQLKAAGLGSNYAQNGFGIFPSDANDNIKPSLR